MNTAAVDVKVEFTKQRKWLPNVVCFIAVVSNVSRVTNIWMLQITKTDSKMVYFVALVTKQCLRKSPPKTLSMPKLSQAHQSSKAMILANVVQGVTELFLMLRKWQWDLEIITRNVSGEYSLMLSAVSFHFQLIIYFSKREPLVYTYWHILTHSGT